ncbi:hypothetical protein PENTCL1PPCAC_3834, partial [Pristionchus entomophagus]
FSSMEAGPDPICVDFLDSYGIEIGVSHEIINVILCLLLMFDIYSVTALKNTYQFNLLPVFLVIILQACAHCAYYSVPYAYCYYPKPPYLAFMQTLMYVTYTFKQTFIMHALIRPTLVFMYSNIGLASSLIIPALFSIVPFAYFIFEFTFHIDPRVIFVAAVRAALLFPSSWLFTNLFIQFQKRPNSMPLFARMIMVPTRQ